MPHLYIQTVKITQFFHIEKAFAGYPLIHNDRVIGVLALFSKKKLSTADFEPLVYLYFCAFNTEYW
jgi:hypothetical protein